ncbi:MAG: hypothetical protein QGH80_04780 [Acidimicrobiales bacterium]|nr:hypothetical protein [Acidimicrobiales bacterium]
MNLAKNIVGCLLGLPFIWIGIQHFVNPKAFNEIVPRYLAAPSFWTYTSGALEILLGIGIMIPVTRTISARLLVVLVLLMSLANLNMYLNDVPFNGTLLNTAGHVIRLIAQVILIAVLLWLGMIF